MKTKRITAGAYQVTYKGIKAIISKGGACNANTWLIDNQGEGQHDMTTKRGAVNWFQAFVDNQGYKGTGHETRLVFA